MKISRQNFVIEKTKTQDHTNAKRHSEVSNPGIFYLQVSSLSSRHSYIQLRWHDSRDCSHLHSKNTFLRHSVSPMMVAADPLALQLLHSFSYYSGRSRRHKDTLQSPGQPALRFTGCVTAVGSHVKYTTQSESYQLLRLLPGQFQLCCLYPSPHLDAHLLRGLPGLLTLTLQPILHPGPATEAPVGMTALRRQRNLLCIWTPSTLPRFRTTLRQCSLSTQVVTCNEQIILDKSN